MDIHPNPDRVHESGLHKSSHTVQPGESLTAIARKHQVGVDQLAKWNNVPVNTNVRSGQTLVVMGKDTAKDTTRDAVKDNNKKSQSAEGSAKTASLSKYKVREGDTLFSISKQFKVSMTDLKKWNGDNVQKQIQPGRNITVLHDAN